MFTTQVVNLRIPRRTAQIDAQREQQIGLTPGGEPIWLHKGDLVPTGDQKHELSAALHAKQRAGAVQTVMIKVLEVGAGFFESVVMHTAPQAVLDSYQSDDTSLFVKWLTKSGYRLVRDGLTCIVLRNGAEIARTTADVPASLKDDVLTMLRFETCMECAKS